MSFLKKITISIIVIFLIVLPFTSGFISAVLGVIDNFIDPVGNTLLAQILAQQYLQTTELTIQTTEQTIMQTIQTYRNEIREIQREIQAVYSLGDRWYYFANTLINQDLLSIAEEYILNGIEGSRLDNLLKQSYGTFGHIRGNKEKYSETFKDISNLLGKPSKSLDPNDPNQNIVFLTNLSAGESINTAANISSYSQQFVKAFNKWTDENTGYLTNEYTDSAALIKALINLEIINFDYRKMHMEYMAAQMRKAGNESMNTYKKTMESANSRRINILGTEEDFQNDFMNQFFERD